LTQSLETVTTFLVDTNNIESSIDNTGEICSFLLVSSIYVLVHYNTLHCSLERDSSVWYLIPPNTKASITFAVSQN